MTGDVEFMTSLKSEYLEGLAPTLSSERIHRSSNEAHVAPLCFYEFFAGGGMARAGLGHDWECLFANDFDFKKSATYQQNWGSEKIKTKDVGKLGTEELPGKPSLIWASFPCQDLSLAGMGAGLKGDRSGTFWPFWKLVEKLREEKRGPKLIVLENVCGTLTSHNGKDFSAICDTLSGAGFRYGAMVIDAAEFVPQSRPRLFIVAADANLPIAENLISDGPCAFRHTRALKIAQAKLSEKTRRAWVWWKLPAAPKRHLQLKDIVEKEPTGVGWHSFEETSRLLAMMSPLNLKKVEAAKISGKLTIGAIYKRTRHSIDGLKVQRAEVRFDGLSGCLRTSAGGSSRQVLLFVNGDEIRSRLISTRETARLMGLPDNYILPDRYNEAYHLTGDGVVVSVVRHLAAKLLEPLLASA